MAKTIGIILIVLGSIGFIVDNATYTESETVVDIGEVELSAEKQESIRIAPVAAGIAVIAGIGLVLVGVKGQQGSS
ncbi:MAG: DUF3185 domain-containing protein [Rhodothermales bacterium]|nr:DUF3185 domain-containing protein [Rhodothermales bacterium]